MQYIFIAALFFTHLQPLESPQGSNGDWVELFDGETLDGWTTKGGRYDGGAEWKVEGGVIVGREGAGGSGGLIYTEKEYENFEVEFDAWISYPFDSGIFPRMKPRSEGNQQGAQICIDYRPGGEVGAIYSDGFYQHNWAGSERFKKDDWNQFKLRCVGTPMHLKCWMNGEVLTDYQLPAGSGNFARRGKLGLQVHGSAGAPEGSKVMFRKLRLRELPAGDCFEAVEGERGEAGQQQITPLGVASGWTALFNGEDLDGWKAAGKGDGFDVKGGELLFLTKGSSPQLMTKKNYADFHLRFEFQIEHMANSGLFLRAKRDGSNPAYSGCELQILDDFNWEKETNSTLKPYQFTGGLYGAKAPDTKDAQKPLGEWNTYDVWYRANRLTVRLNGRKMHDIDTHKVGGQPPFAERAKTGFIGLQRHSGSHADVEAFARFRNIFLREL
jgi:hypothetical protein